MNKKIMFVFGIVLIAIVAIILIQKFFITNSSDYISSGQLQKIISKQSNAKIEISGESFSINEPIKMQIFNEYSEKLSIKNGGKIIYEKSGDKWKVFVEGSDCKYPNCLVDYEWRGIEPGKYSNFSHQFESSGEYI